MATHARGRREGRDPRAGNARFGPLIERCELDHDQVIMVCGSVDSHAGERLGMG